MRDWARKPVRPSTSQACSWRSSPGFLKQAQVGFDLFFFPGFKSPPSARFCVTKWKVRGPSGMGVTRTPVVSSSQLSRQPQPSALQLHLRPRKHVRVYSPADQRRFPNPNRFRLFWEAFSSLPTVPLHMEPQPRPIREELHPPHQADE